MKKTIVLALFACIFIIDFVNAQVDSILLIDSITNIKKVSIHIGNFQSGTFKGISQMNAQPTFNGLKVYIDFKNEGDTITKLSIPIKMVDTNGVSSSFNDDYSYIIAEYLEKFINLYKRNEWDDELHAIVYVWTINKKNIILKEYVHSKGNDLVFFDEEQNIVAKLNSNNIIEIYPKSKLSIPVFYNSTGDKPKGLIIK